jgi:Ca2+-transporting ATPase
VFAGTLLPILPVQILWINMATAVLLGATLTFEPKEAGIMSRPPRAPHTPLLESVLIQRIVLVGIMLLGGAFGLFQFGLQIGQTIEEARTLAVNVIVFGEIFYLLNCRSLTQPWWTVGVFSNRIVLIGAAIMAGLQMLFTYLPAMNSLFRTAPLPAREWIWIMVVGVGIHVVVEAEKWVRRILSRRKGEEPVC